MQVTVTFPAHLVQPLVGLIDAGLRATGIRSAREAAELVELIDKAVQQAQAGVQTVPEPQTGKAGR